MSWRQALQLADDHPNRLDDRTNSTSNIFRPFWSWFQGLHSFVGADSLTFSTALHLTPLVSCIICVSTSEHDRLRYCPVNYEAKNISEERFSKTNFYVCTLALIKMQHNSKSVNQSPNCTKSVLSSDQRRNPQQAKCLSVFQAFQHSLNFSHPNS